MGSPALSIVTRVDMAGARQMSEFGEEFNTVTQQMQAQINSLAAAVTVLEEKMKKSVASDHEKALSLKEVGEAATKSGEALKGMSAGFGGLGAVIGIGVFTEMIEKMKETVLQSSHLSEATGVSIVKLVEFKDVMAAAGVSTERLPMQMQKLAGAIEQGQIAGTKQSKAFAELGVSQAFLTDKHHDAIDVLAQVALHLHGSEEASKDLQSMQALLGRGAVTLTSALKDQGSQLNANLLTHQAHGEAVKASVVTVKQLQMQEAQLREDMETALLPALNLVIKAIDYTKIGVAGLGAFYEAFGVTVLKLGDLLVHSWEHIGTIVTDVVTGNFKRLPQDVRIATREIAADSVAWTDALTKIATDTKAKIDAIMAPKKTVIYEGKEAPSLPDPKKDTSLAEAKARLEAAKQIGDAQRALEDEQEKIRLANGLITEAQYAEMLRTSENKRFDDETEYYKKLEAIEEKDPEKDATKIIAIHGQIEAMRIKHQETLLKIDQDAFAKQRAEDGKQIEHRLASMEKEIQEEIKVKQAGFAREEKEIKSRFDLRKITSEQELAQLKAVYAEEEKAGKELLDKQEQIEILRVQAVAAASGKIITDIQAKEFPAIQAIENAKVQLTEQTLTKQLTAQEKYTLTLKQMKESEFAAITNSFNSSIQGFIQGNDTLTQSVSKMWVKMSETMINSLIQAGEQMLVNWALQEVTDEKSKLSTAKVAAAKAWDAMVGIPIIGPALGAIAAAATFAGIMAFEKGGIVPQDSMALVHANEMVLPANISTQIQNMTSNNSATSSGPEVHLHVQALDAGSFHSYLHGNLGAIGSAVVAASKGGHLNPRDFPQ